MKTPPLPPPQLIWLRTAATVVLSCLIGQAGWASAFLGGDPRFVQHHAVGAWVTLAAAVGAAVLYVVLRRSAGAVNVALALAVAGLVVVQLVLGRTGADRALHIFLGVLLAMLGTALTSWTYRHRLPDGASSTSSRPRSV